MDKDPAFLWETEALRSGRTDVKPDVASVILSEPAVGVDPLEPPQPSLPLRDRWVTPEEASFETGIPLDTLVKWMLTETVRSQLDMTVDPPVRKINLATVPAPQQPARQMGQAARTSQPTRAAQGSPSPRAPVQARGEVAAPPGTMIVPIAAWDKMLMQLGNLHEAGRELAAARERAAKAETEARFLRERLAELRAEMASHPAAPSPSPEAAPPEQAHGDVQGNPAAGPAEPLWRAVYETLRRRRRR